VSGEAVFGWFAGDRLPPLITTSPAGTPMSQAGVLPLPNTSVLYGNDTVNDELRYGFRLGAGYWFTPERRLGIEAGGMILESQSALFDIASGGTPTLARPYLDATTGIFQAALIASGSSSGSIDVRSSSGNLYEAHLDLTERVLDDGWVRLDSLFGYRFYRYDEGLRIRQTLSPIGGAFAVGTQLASNDDFTTHNTFNGGDFGFRTQFFWQNFSVGLLSKLAVGGINRDVKILGGTLVSVPGSAPVPEVGGLYALVSNIGSHHTHDWTVLPELGANLAWQVTPNVRVTVGYSVLWLDRIARAADQIDFTINPAFIPPATAIPGATDHPAFFLIRNDMWLQTANVGVELSY
jgi:hypothetical protein